MDILTREQRADIMSGIRARDTRPEMAVRSALHGMGFRFRLCVKGLPGRPDVVLPRWRTIVFVHGCFWHRHQGCKAGTSTPATNTAFWERKFARNAERDRAACSRLEGMGWRVIVIWECETRDITTLRRRLFEEIAGEGPGLATCGM